MHDETNTLKERNDARRLENEATRLQQGYVRRFLLPAVTVTLAFVICAYSLRYFCIKGTIFDTSEAAADRDIFYDAQRSYNDGNLDLAVNQTEKILAKVPAHAPANQLMARIALARGDRKAAIGYLRRSLDGALDREEVAKWIATLEAGTKD